jgi:hypothetical protein
LMMLMVAPGIMVADNAARPPDNNSLPPDIPSTSYSSNFDAFGLRTSGAARPEQPIQHARVATELPTTMRPEACSSAGPIELPAPRTRKKGKRAVIAETSAAPVELPATTPTHGQGQRHSPSREVQGRAVQSSYIGGAGESSRQASSRHSMAVRFTLARKPKLSTRNRTQTAGTSRC